METDRLDGERDFQRVAKGAKYLNVKKEPKLEEIIICAMGPTWYQCPTEAPPNSEIWGVNTMYRNRKLDRIFIMHDIKHDLMVQDRDFFKTANELKIPVVTSGDYAGFDNNFVFPAEDVVDHFGVAYFLNVMSWMIAYAIMMEPKRISLYGCDMRSDSGDEYRLGERGCVEYWLGMAMGRGIDLGLPQESFLLKRVMRGNFYGYYLRKKAKGLDELIPDATKRKYRNYMLIPTEDDGTPIDDVTPITMQGRGYKG